MRLVKRWLDYHAQLKMLGKIGTPSANESVKGRGTPTRGVLVGVWPARAWRQG